MPNREQFEAWAKTQGPANDEKSTLEHMMFMHIAWIAWQAGAAAEREKCAKICEDLAAPEGMHGTAVSIWDVATLDCAEAIIRDRSAP